MVKSEIVRVVSLSATEIIEVTLLKNTDLQSPDTLRFSPLLHNYLTIIRKKALENMVGKEENAANQNLQAKRIQCVSTNLLQNWESGLEPIGW